MSIRAILGPFRLTLLSLITLALMATGFAHRAPSGDEEALQAAWVMAGGNWDGFCGDPGMGATPHVKCPACQLTDAAGPPSAPNLPQDAQLRLMATLPASPVSAPPQPIFGPALGPRAPPFA